MSFLSAGWFALAALLPLIVIMYLLRLRRVERPVASTYLWRRLVRDVEANAPWQRLRRNLLFFLQLLFLAALILAVARPATPAKGEFTGQALILVMDTSASMAATDISPNRLESARRQALELVQDLPAGVKVTVISAGAQARAVVSSSDDPRQVQRAINELQIENGSSDMAVALQLASAIAARQPGSHIAVFSDGNVTLPERATVKGDLSYTMLGEHSANQAISLLRVQRGTAGSAGSAFAQVTNYGVEPAVRRLAFFADGQMVSAQDLSIAPGQAVGALPVEVISTTQVVEARLMPADAAGMDYLPLDDAAYAVQPKPAAVALYTPGNLFLETALRLMPGVASVQVNPPAADLENSQLVVIDGSTAYSGTLPAHAALLFIGPTRSSELFSIGGLLQNPRPVPVDPGDPLLAYVDLSNVSILDSAYIPLPGWGRSLVVSGKSDSSAGTASGPAEGAPLIYVGEPHGRRVAVVAFDLRRSDLPLNLAFPMLLANLTAWLVPGAAGSLTGQVAPGEVLALALPPSFIGPDAPPIQITYPDGSTTNLQPQDNRLLVENTRQTGIYTIRLGDQPPLQFAVNLFAPQESAIQPAVEFPVTSGAASQAGTPQQILREWWRPLALVALLLLLAEWLVYQRAALRMLYRRILPGKTTPKARAR